MIVVKLTRILAWLNDLCVLFPVELARSKKHFCFGFSSNFQAFWIFQFLATKTAYFLIWEVSCLSWCFPGFESSTFAHIKWTERHQETQKMTEEESKRNEPIDNDEDDEPDEWWVLKSLKVWRNCGANSSRDQRINNTGCAGKWELSMIWEREPETNYHIDENLKLTLCHADTGDWRQCTKEVSTPVSHNTIVTNEMCQMIAFKQCWERNQNNLRTSTVDNEKTELWSVTALTYKWILLVNRINVEEMTKWRNGETFGSKICRAPIGAHRPAKEGLTNIEIVEKHRDATIYLSQRA